MTLRAYDIFLTPIFRSNYESGRPLGLDIIYADIKKSKLKIVRFTGDTSVFSGFGILGGYPFPVQTEPLVVKFPVKEAVKKMESIFGEKKCLETMEAAMDAVMKTLFEFDPITKKETYEFTVFEGGVLNSTYIERIQQKNNEK
jgi:hypothetical protein